MAAADDQRHPDPAGPAQPARVFGTTDLDGSSSEWLAAVASALATPEEYVVCLVNDLGGHELALLDFDPAAAERLRAIGRLIEIPDAPDVVTALAISGSAAQARIQPFPADADFFERVHLRAPDRAAAARRFADLVRANALRTAERPELRLVEVYFGRQPSSERTIRWSPAEVRAVAAVRTVDGADVAIGWDEAADDPAFVKLDWLLLDRALGGPRKVSKVIDGTWERPDGAVESLDGLIDADFQQVYLTAEDGRAAARLVAHAAPDLGRAAYLRFMDQEIVKHLRQIPPDYVKIAKRLYNRCRLTGHFAEALCLRDLFDDSPARLVQIRGRLQIVDERCRSDPDGAAAELRVFLVEHEDLTSDEVGALRAAVLADPLTAAALSEAIGRLDEALAAEIAESFGARLRASTGVAVLLAEIAAASGS